MEKHIYIFKTENGSCKIGVSKNIEQRKKTISCLGNSKIIDIFYTPKCSNAYKIEGKMHKYFEQYRVTGEWFNIDFDMACTKLKEMFKQYAITITSRDNIKLYDYYSGIKSNFKNTTMKLFLSKEILTTDKETAVLAVLNGMYSNKQEQLFVSVTFIGYAMCGRFLKSEKRQERTILEGIREALKGLAEKNIIEILDQDKDNYVLSNKGLEIDTSKENFTVVELWELQKIFQNTNKPFGVFEFFSMLIGTINNKTKEWHMSQDEMVEYWKYGKETINTYLHKLEELELIYVYRHKRRRADGTYYKLNNSYGRYEDRKQVISAALEYSETVETSEFIEKVDRRSIKLRYNSYCNGSQKYMENPEETVSLYQECIKYNKSLKIKPIDGTYDGQYKQSGELDLSVFPENIIKLDLENEDNWGEPDHIA